MHYTKAVFATAILTSSLAVPLAWAQDESVQSGPRTVGETAAYRLEFSSSGTKEARQGQTTLTLTRTAQGVHVASASPAEEAAGNVDPSGVVHVDGDLSRLVEPYNQLQTALNGRDGHGRSTVTVVVGKQEVSVPVALTTTQSGATMSFAFTGQTGTKVRGVGAHVAVDMHAAVVAGRVENASARNTFDASVPFRKIHVEQAWSLTRMP